MGMLDRFQAAPGAGPADAGSSSSSDDSSTSIESAFSGNRARMPTYLQRQQEKQRSDTVEDDEGPFAGQGRAPTYLQRQRERRRSKAATDPSDSDSDSASSSDVEVQVKSNSGSGSDSGSGSGSGSLGEYVGKKFTDATRGGVNTVVNVATGGNAEETREKYRTDSEGSQQVERSESNIEEQGFLGRMGARLELGTDYLMDYPGASVQNEAAEAAGGRQTIAETYEQVTTETDATLAQANLDTRSNPVTRFGADVFVEPVAQGFSKTFTGTDLETGEKANATGEDIGEVMLSAAFFPTGGAGSRVVSGGARTVTRAANAASMVNPIRLARGTFSAGEDVVSATRRTLSSSDNVPAVRREAERLEGLEDWTAAPRRVEQSEQTRYSTRLNRLRNSEGGAGSPNLRDDLPTRVDETTQQQRGSTRFGSSETSDRFDDVVYDLERGEDGVFRTSRGSRRSTEEAAEGASQTRRGDDAQESGSVVENVRSNLNQAFNRGSGATRTAGQAAGVGFGVGRRGASGAADAAGSIFNRVRQTFSRGEDAADAGRRAEDAGDATRASERPQDATSARRAEEGAENARRTERAEDASDGRRAEEPEGRSPRTRRPRDGGGGGGRIRRWIRNNPLTTALTGGGLAAALGAGVTLSQLEDPGPQIQGDGWYAQQVKPYTVETDQGETATIYLYEVFGTDGSNRGYTVVLGADPDTGRIRYLGGNPERPSVAKSDVTAKGLSQAASRAAEQAANQSQVNQTATPGGAAR